MLDTLTSMSLLAIMEIVGPIGRARIWDLGSVEAASRIP